MSVDFGAMLSDEQKRQLLNSRIQQYAAEGYQHSLNKQIAEEQGDEQGVTQSEQAMSVLSDAITVHERELASLPSAESVEG